MSSQYDIYYTFDMPVPYKGLLLHPIRMKHYLVFFTLANCLMLEKNSVPDIKTISMTYLQYMFYVSSKENNMIALFDGLLRLVLNKGENDEIKYAIGNDGKPLFMIDDITYNSDDFDVLRNIIAEQNSLELPDETIQKEVRLKMEEARRFKQKLNRSKIASLEEQILALAIYSGWDMETIYNMTIRKFFLAIGRANHMIMSNIYLTASMSGFVTFKDKSVLKGWLAEIKEADKNSDVTMSLDSIQNKINFNEAKEK